MISYRDQQVVNMEEERETPSIEMTSPTWNVGAYIPSWGSHFNGGSFPFLLHIDHLLISVGNHCLIPFSLSL